MTRPDQSTDRLKHLICAVFKLQFLDTHCRAPSIKIKGPPAEATFPSTNDYTRNAFSHSKMVKMHSDSLSKKVIIIIYSKEQLAANKHSVQLAASRIFLSLNLAKMQRPNHLQVVFSFYHPLPQFPVSWLSCVPSARRPRLSLRVS